MEQFRGRAGVTVFVSVLAVASAIACGSSGDDAPAGPPKDAHGGSSGGSSGTDATGGAPDETGGTSASGQGGGSTTGGSSSKGGGSSKGGSAGTGGAKGGGSGTSGTSASELLDAVGDACKKDCDAQFALDCAPMNSNSLTCQLSCAAQTTQLGDFCLGEYRDLVACKADGGYDCVTSYPYPRSTCAVEQQAFSMCTQHIGCKRYCSKIADLGCNDTPFDTCLDDCTQEDTTLPSGCVYRTENIAYCQATGGATCDGDTLSVPAACSSSVLSVAECISDDSSDLCDGWCWAADHLGCGTKDCKSDCAAKKSPAQCGSEWDSLLDCVLFFDEGKCDGDSLIGSDICDSEQQAYTKCVSGDAGAN